jgi:N-acetylneuraminic acid mutarotase
MAVGFNLKMWRFMIRSETSGRQALTYQWLRKAPAGAAINGKFYVVGGFIRPANVNIGALQIYDPATNRWTSGSPMPTPRSSLTTVVIDGKLYAVGGGNGTTLVSTVEIYDPTSDTWTTGASAPTPRGLAAGGVIDSNLYITGGYNASEVIDGSLEVYIAVCP